ADRDGHERPACIEQRREPAQIAEQRIADVLHLRHVKAATASASTSMFSIALRASDARISGGNVQSTRGPWSSSQYASSASKPGTTSPVRALRGTPGAGCDGSTSTERPASEGARAFG